MAFSDRLEKTIYEAAVKRNAVLEAVAAHEPFDLEFVRVLPWRRYLDDIGSMLASD